MYKVEIHKDQPYKDEVNQDLAGLVRDIREEIEAGGFRAEISPVVRSGHMYSSEVQIKTVRLQQNKEYCGNHPGPCKIIPGFERPHRRLNCLEGGDWVIFNDLVNDVLDRHYLSAKVSSSQCVMRLGTKRRVHYGMNKTGRLADDWKKIDVLENYQDWCGVVAPRATAPRGTPALPLEQGVA